MPWRAAAAAGRPCADCQAAPVRMFGTILDGLYEGTSRCERAGIPEVGCPCTLRNPLIWGEARNAAVIWSPNLGVFAVNVAGLDPRRGLVIWSVSSQQQKRPDSRLTLLTCDPLSSLPTIGLCRPAHGAPAETCLRRRTGS